jgi:Domain of unknown function (DUF4214)
VRAGDLPEYIVAQSPSSNAAAPTRSRAFSLANDRPTLDELCRRFRGRAAALRKVAESDSLTRSEFDPAFVLMEYFGYLRRDPDAAGYNFWLTKLEQFNGNYIQAEMVKAFISSDEYRRRFGQ